MRLVVIGAVIAALGFTMSLGVFAWGGRVANGGLDRRFSTAPGFLVLVWPSPSLHLFAERSAGPAHRRRFTNRCRHRMLASGKHRWLIVVWASGIDPGS